MSTSEKHVEITAVVEGGVRKGNASVMRVTKVGANCNGYFQVFKNSPKLANLYVIFSVLEYILP